MASADKKTKEAPCEEAPIAPVAPCRVSVIAQPLVTGKASGRLLKAVRQAAKEKSLKRGVKEVVKSLRRGLTGIVVMAGDISPIDVLTHVPLLCEEAAVPYAFVSSKAELGAAGATRRPTCCVLVPAPQKAKGSKAAPAAETEALVKVFEKALKEVKGLTAC